MKSTLLLLVLYLLIVDFHSYSQDSWWKNKKYKSKEKQQKYDYCKITFQNISDGFQYNNVTYISPYIKDELYLNLPNTEKGNYNKQQCIYILETFFNNFRVYSFKWRNASASELYAFAMGKYKYRKNGFINTFTVSVSLKYINNLWLVEQILVN